jgi:membrane peptidoglycan carboxypeptidase
MKALDSLLARFFGVFASILYQDQAAAVLRIIRHGASLSPPQSDLSSAISALIEAEDHRFLSHKGIDSRAILRAMVVTAFTRRLEGASTITQQLVRVASQDYRRTISRKFKELCLAAWIDSRVSKIEQAATYLRFAYFGWEMNGFDQALIRLQFSLPLSDSEAAALIARLKYPEPRVAKEIRRAQISARQLHILERMKRSK